VRRFQARCVVTAAIVALTDAAAAATLRESFRCHGIKSRWVCPPTWLHSASIASRARKNSMIYRVRAKA
jgi:hypothetical protein